MSSILIVSSCLSLLLLSLSIGTPLSVLAFVSDILFLFSPGSISVSESSDLSFISVVILSLVLASTLTSSMRRPGSRPSSSPSPVPSLCFSPSSILASVETSIPDDGKDVDDCDDDNCGLSGSIATEDSEEDERDSPANDEGVDGVVVAIRLGVPRGVCEGDNSDTRYLE